MYLYFSSLLFSCLVMSSCLQPHGLQYVRLSCPSLSPEACSNSCLLSQWCHATILSSVVPFSCCPQSLPASGSFPMSWLFASGGPSIGASASASVLPINTQCWFPLGLTGLISLQSKRLPRVFSNTTVQNHLTRSNFHFVLLLNICFNLSFNLKLFKTIIHFAIIYLSSLCILATRKIFSEFLYIQNCLSIVCT